jgi:hypothetical protein
MKPLSIVLLSVCVLQGALIAYLWKDRSRLSVDPHSFTTFKTKPGEIVILVGTSPKLEGSYSDDGENSSFKAIFKTNDGDTTFTGFFAAGRPTWTYFSRRENTNILLRDIDDDGIPRKKSVTFSGKTECFERKSIEWVLCPETEGPTRR